MKSGLIIKALREVWPAALAFGIALAAFEALIVRIMPNFYDQIEFILQVKFVQFFLQGLLGTRIVGLPGPEIVVSLAWVHPIALVLLFGCMIMLCTRIPVGEIDRGTIDILLSCPVSRLSVYLSECAVWVSVGFCVILTGCASNLLVSLSVAETFRAPLDRVGIIVINALCLYFSVGGITCWISSLCSHRGRAVGISFGIILSFFLLNFLVQVWPAVAGISFLSLLNYYQPLLILQQGLWPVKNIVILLTTGSLFWLAGAFVFCRRNICTT